MSSPYNLWVLLSIKFLQGALAKTRPSRFAKVQKIIYDLLCFCVDPFIVFKLIYIYIYIYIYNIVLCIMVAGFIIKRCWKYFQTLDTPLRIGDSWLDFSNKRDFFNDRCHSVEIMYFPYFFVWRPWTSQRGNCW